MEKNQIKSLLTDGDIILVITNDNKKFIAIFQRFLIKDRLAIYANFYYEDYNTSIADKFDGYDILCDWEEVNVIRLATLEERQLLFIKLAENCKKWNPTTKQIEDIPKPHIFKPFDRVLVRDGEDDKWRAQLFSHIDRDAEYPYICISNPYKHCIPYEGNEHLLGTTNSPEGGAE